MKSVIKAGLILIGIAALWLPVQAQHTSVAVEAKAVAAAPGRGTLYRVEHAGNAAYLFGTVHVGRPEFLQLGPVVEQALTRSRRLVLELDIRNQQPVQHAIERYGLYSPGRALEEHLSPDTLHELQGALPRYELDAPAVTRMKPWLIANLLLSLDLERNGYQRRYGAEYALLDAARELPVSELETAEYQLSLFDSMTPHEQEAYLRDTLAELKTGAALDEARALLGAWADADTEALEDAWKTALAKDTSGAEFTRNVLLGARNPGMANEVEQLLRKEGVSFVAVGMLHLLGETGVPALLAQRGYHVQRLY